MLSLFEYLGMIVLVYLLIFFLNSVSHRIQGSIKESGAFVYTRALRHWLQCAAVSVFMYCPLLFIVTITVQNNCLCFFRHCKAVDLAVKEDTLELLVQGCFFLKK